jgi:hypothetical protein
MRWPQFILGPFRSMDSLLPKTWAVSTGGCNTGLQFTRRSLKAQGFPRALIEAQRYFVDFGLRVLRQIGFLRKVPSQEPVRVFIGAALPDVGGLFLHGGGR